MHVTGNPHEHKTDITKFLLNYGKERIISRNPLLIECQSEILPKCRSVHIDLILTAHGSQVKAAAAFSRQLWFGSLSAFP